MNKRLWYWMMVLLLGGSACEAGTERGPAPQGLRADFLPAGDDSVLYFSWQLSQAQRGVRQASYQVLVATRAEWLTPDAVDVWNSQQVMGTSPLFQPYQGPPRPAGKPLYWTVRLWNAAGQDTDWAEPQPLLPSPLAYATEPTFRCSDSLLTRLYARHSAQLGSYEPERLPLSTWPSLAQRQRLAPPTQITRARDARRAWLTARYSALLTPLVSALPDSLPVLTLPEDLPLAVDRYQYVHHLAQLYQALGRHALGDSLQRALAAWKQDAFLPQFYAPDRFAFGVGDLSQQVEVLAAGLGTDAITPAVVRSLAAELLIGGLDPRLLDCEARPHGLPLLSQAQQHELAYRVARNWGQLTDTCASRLGLNTWLMEELVGIQPLGPARGYRLRPRPIAEMRFAEGQWPTPYGRLSCRWARDSSQMTLALILPPGPPAYELWLPVGDPTRTNLREGERVLFQGGQPQVETNFVQLMEVQAGWIVYRLQSGTYRFVW